MDSSLLRKTLEFARNFRASANPLNTDKGLLGSEAVFLRKTGRALLNIPSSPKNVLVSSSPPAERASIKGVSGVSNPNKPTIYPKGKIVKRIGLTSGLTIAEMFRRILVDRDNLFGNILKGGTNVIEIQNELKEKSSLQKTFNPQPLYLKETGKTYTAKPLKEEYKQPIKEASERTGLDPVLLTAILMKESEMGTNPGIDNIAELKAPAIGHLKEKGIKVDLKTDKGVIDAMADYLKLRKYLF